MYHIAICDDDQFFIIYIKKIIVLSGLDISQILFYEYNSGEDLILAIKENNEYDLLILDMQMRDMDGYETATLFRKKYENTILVFCSGKVKPTTKSFEVTPYRYLLKQYSDSRMIREMKPVIEKMKSIKTEPYVIGSYQYNVIKLKPEDILYIAVSKHGSDVYMLRNKMGSEFDRKVKSKEKVKELYLMLRNYGFAYAHNSYIVNLKYITRKTLTELELVDGTILSISRSKEKELRRALAELLALKYE